MSWWKRTPVEETGVSLAVFRAMNGLLEGALAHNRELVATLAEMKREGFHPAPPVDQLEASTLTVPEPVELAIRDRAPQGSELESDLRRWGAEMVRGGADPGKVAEMVFNGGGDDGG